MNSSRVWTVLGVKITNSWLTKSRSQQDKWLGAGASILNETIFTNRGREHSAAHIKVKIIRINSTAASLKFCGHKNQATILHWDGDNMRTENYWGLVTVTACWKLNPSLLHLHGGGGKGGGKTGSFHLHTKIRTWFRKMTLLILQRSPSNWLFFWQKH